MCKRDISRDIWINRIQLVKSNNALQNLSKASLILYYYELILLGIEGTPWI